MADDETTQLCVITVGARMPESVLISLQERFDRVSASGDGTTLTVDGVDQAAVRALLTHLWDVGLDVHDMSWTPQG